MLLAVVLLCSLSLTAIGQEVDDDWIDPYDMLNYDASTKTMRKPAEPAKYDSVPTKRREHSQVCDQVETQCHTEVEQLKKTIALISQQPTCNPVFKRFLTRLLKEIGRVGLPSNSEDLFFDAKIRLSTQAMAEIEALLNGEDSWRTGALDNAISQILVDLRPHNYEAWRWRFEDTFGVELDTVLKMAGVVLLIVAIVCTQLWSTVSWFMQFGRLFAVSFFVSVIWNWLYLYKIAFAEHQSNLAKMDSVFEKCTGVKKIDWSDSLKEWFRSTWTLQGDPCKKYYELLMVNPILLVPPTKALAVTITTFFTEPLKHVGQGISEFLVALLKDLPITLQIPVLITIVLAIVVCMYGGVHAAFQHGITAPFRRPRRDPPPPQLERPRPHVQEIEDDNHIGGGGDAQQHAPRPQGNVGRVDANQVRHRQSNRCRKEPAKEVVETLGTADPHYSGDETDDMQQTNLSAEPENVQETQEDLKEESVASAANTTQTNINSTTSDSSPTNDQPVKEKKKLSKDQVSKNSAAPTPPQTDVQLCTNGMVNIHLQHKTDLQPLTEDTPRPASLLHIENIRVSVQETSVE